MTFIASSYNGATTIIAIITLHENVLCRFAFCWQ